MGGAIMGGKGGKGGGKGGKGGMVMGGKGYIPDDKRGSDDRPYVGWWWGGRG